MIAERSSVNARLRTSITTATLVTAPRAWAPSSTMVEINSGGRLSTTNQPRSSRHLAAVLRPAPDRPVTTATSTPWPGGPAVPSAWPDVAGSSLMIGPLVCRMRLRRGDYVGPGSAPGSGQGLVHRLGGVRADARCPADLLEACLTQSLERAEMLQQRGLPGLPEAGDAVQHRGGHPLGAALPVV